LREIKRSKYSPLSREQFVELAVEIAKSDFVPNWLIDTMLFWHRAQRHRVLWPLFEEAFGGLRGELAIAENALYSSRQKKRAKSDHDVPERTCNKVEARCEIIEMLGRRLSPSEAAYVNSVFRDEVELPEIGAAVEELNRPHRIMIVCPERKLPVFTGTEATREQFDDTDFTFMETMCPHCHSPHTWTRSGMYLEDTAARS
jgi:hypothetical protein